MSVIPAHGRLRQENLKFEASLSGLILSQKPKKKRKEGRKKKEGRKEGKKDNEGVVIVINKLVVET
jgi:hypothetical protein